MRIFKVTGLGIGFLTATIQAVSVELRTDNIKAHISSGQWFIEHFSPWCIHCKQFAPTWEQLTEDFGHFAKEKDFHFGTIDCSVQGDLCDEHDVIGTPEMQLWNAGQKVEKYTESREYDVLAEYIKKKANAYSENNSLGDEEETFENEEISEEGENDINEEQEDEEEDDLNEEEAEDEEGSEEDEEEPEDVEEEIDEEAEEIEEKVVVKPDEKAQQTEETTEKSLPNPLGISVDLNEKQMKEVLSKPSDVWFIKFYAPWCPHCQALAPTWEALASQLQNEVNIGEVNCVDHGDICNEHGIEGYPTLLLFGNGKPINYNGDRSLMSLINFAKANAGPVVKQVNMGELEKYVKTKDVSLVYLSNNKEIPELIERAARTYMNTVSFYATEDANVFKAYSVGYSDLPAVMVLKDGKQKMYTAHDFKDTESNEKTLFDWIEKEQYPLVSKLNPSNYQSILEGKKPVVLNIINAQDTVSQTRFHKAAIAWDRSSQGDGAIFAEMDHAMWGQYVRDKFNVEHNNVPKIVIYNTATSEYFDKDVKGVELSSENPEGIYLILENLDRLRGSSALAVHEKVFNSVQSGFHAVGKHWFISIILFSVLGSYLYKHSSNHRPKKAYILPSHND
ncbi:hypothetical protein G6F43_011304 [Rhizopus delemar]|nr:hypothetical protein G6F43_011304 [Rhizopus delemar]